MTDRPTADQIRAYLAGTGWTLGPTGTRAAVWRRLGGRIRLPHDMADWDLDKAVVDIALAEDRHPGNVRADVLAHDSQSATERSLIMNDDVARTFTLIRRVDHTGVSGTGIVAEGVRFSDGTVVLRWRGQYASTVVWASLDDAMHVHGHDGATTVMWDDLGIPKADWSSSWTELTGYVQQAHDDGDPWAADVLAYMRELKHKALAPVREWMASLGQNGGNDD